jgi:mannose-6-phosphate isomerase
VNTTSNGSLYPLRFEPIFEYRPWGGRHLEAFMATKIPDGPIGEAWLLSDREDHPSVVAEGPLKGQTIRQLLVHSATQLLGSHHTHVKRFPLLLKFLDVHETLSVQVHPSDEQTKYVPTGETGKTEAWVVLEAGTKSHVWAGLAPNATAQSLRHSLSHGTIVDQLTSFVPHVGDAVLIPAGTAHALGGDVVVFEIQQNSDVTFRLYDWDHIDATTGKKRALQIDQALACIDFTQGELGPISPLLESTTPFKREELFDGDYFRVWRNEGRSPFGVGAENEVRILVCIAGEGQIEYKEVSYPLARGEVMLIPASVGECVFRPLDAVNLLEVALPAPSNDAHVH